MLSELKNELRKKQQQQKPQSTNLHSPNDLS